MSQSAAHIEDRIVLRLRQPLRDRLRSNTSTRSLCRALRRAQLASAMLDDAPQGVETPVGGTTVALAGCPNRRDSAIAVYSTGSWITTSSSFPLGRAIPAWRPQRHFETGHPDLATDQTGPPKKSKSHAPVRFLRRSAAMSRQRWVGACGSSLPSRTSCAIKYPASLTR